MIQFYGEKATLHSENMFFNGKFSIYEYFKKQGVFKFTPTSLDYQSINGYSGLTLVTVIGLSEYNHVFYRTQHVFIVKNKLNKAAIIHHSIFPC